MGGAPWTEHRTAAVTRALDPVGVWDRLWLHQELRRVPDNREIES